MSVHKSLRTAGGMVRQRNVFNRWERLQKLKEQGRWSEGQPVFGIPKVRTSVVKMKGKAKAKPKAEGAEGAAKPAEGAEAAAKPGEKAAPAKKEEGKKK